MKLAGEKASLVTTNYADEIFEELYKVWSKPELDNALMALAKGGKRIERVGQALARMEAVPAEIAKQAVKPPEKPPEPGF
jgi:hypothetical protein